MLAARCVDHFRGIFAFAVRDAHRRRILAGDRLGKKRVFDTIADGRFLFASELPSLPAHPAARKEVDPRPSTTA